MRLTEYAAAAGAAANLGFGRRSAPSRSCGICPLYGPCNGGDRPPRRPAAPDTLFRVARRLRRGEALFRMGDPFHSIFAVYSGSFKTCVNGDTGTEIVTGFQMGGDLVGLDGICSDAHAESALALEDSAVCAVPFARLAALVRCEARYQGLVNRVLGVHLSRDRNGLCLLRSQGSRQRVAGFLTDLSERYRARGYSPLEFHIKMRRSDIASYLGIRLETVCRALGEMDRRGLIEVDKTLVRLLDPDALKRYANGSADFAGEAALLQAA